MLKHSMQIIKLAKAHMLGHFMHMLQISSFAIQLALNKHAWFCGAGRAVDSLGVLLFTGVSPGEYFLSSLICSHVFVLLRVVV
jgi:hypothetical protein